jgi:hypothetical protein
MEGLEILKYTLPAIIVFLTSYLTIRVFLEKDERKRRLEYNINNQKIITPIKLQAYERIILFLERTAPEALIIRTQASGMTAKNLQSALLTTIRTEFEHNLSQQIYITIDSWEAVKSAKESIIKLINAASMRVGENGKAMDLSKIIVEMYLSVEDSPTNKAIEILKNEIQNTFG